MRVLRGSSSLVGRVERSFLKPFLMIRCSAQLSCLCSSVNMLVGTDDSPLDFIEPVVIGNIGEEVAASPAKVRTWLALMLLKSSFCLARVGWDRRA